MDFPSDIPSPIDLQDEAHAREWASRATASRPWRIDFFECIARHLMRAGRTIRVLELGSGPGFLAERILVNRPDAEMVLFDYSAPMHALARERLSPFLDRVSFVLGNFREESWADGLSGFDHVVTNQAVHELRHKRHATRLHAEVRQTLGPAGTYFVSDHYAGDEGMANGELYMTVEEQEASLHAAGFSAVDRLLLFKGMVLHRAA